MESVRESGVGERGEDEVIYWLLYDQLKKTSAKKNEWWCVKKGEKGQEEGGGTRFE